MKEINLRDFYPEIYHNDCFINLPDEIVDVLEEYRRKEIAYHRRTYRHKAQYSLEYGNNIEREAVLLTPTLQEIVERHMEEERMYQAIFTLPTKQCQSMRLLTAVSLVRVQQGEFFIALVNENLRALFFAVSLYTCLYHLHKHFTAGILLPVKMSVFLDTIYRSIER